MLTAAAIALPALAAPADGTAMAEAFTPFVSPAAGGEKASLRDSDGSALVTHARSGDYASQPIGGAGDRVACAAIKVG